MPASRPDAPDSPRWSRRWLRAPSGSMRAMAVVLLVGSLAHSLALSILTHVSRITELQPVAIAELRLLLLHVLAGVPVVLVLISAVHSSSYCNGRTTNRRAGRAVALATGSLLLISGFLLLGQRETGLLSPQLWWIVHLLTGAVFAAVVWYQLQLRRGTDGWFAVIGVCSVLPWLLPTVIPQTEPATTEPGNTVDFHPSPVRSSTGEHIPARHLDRSQTCLECHPEVHSDWSGSAHRFSSFNNPAYLAAFVEARSDFLERDGNADAVRWCAGCHDPVPLLSGQLDPSTFDPRQHAHDASGITCTVCHAITDVADVTGNGNYTITPPQLYPLEDSSHESLRWLGRRLIQTRPALHRRTFLRELHRTSEFCASCHKVHIPEEVTRYRDFLRGQNHYDSWLLSGWSGHSARSFYYSDQGAVGCRDCHMPEKNVEASSGSPKLIHDHLFPGANTAVPYWHGRPDVIQRHQQFMENVVRVDLFGIRTSARLDAPLIAPVRPRIPKLEPGRSFLLSTVVRNLLVGHHFTEGTADSNQVWLELTVLSEDRTVAASGQIGADGQVDPSAFFLNTFLLDRDGRRITRRNIHNALVPLYQHQIAPGTARTVHHRFSLPETISGPVTVRARVLYRKFSQPFLRALTKTAQDSGIDMPDVSQGLPVSVLAEDVVVFPTTAAPPAVRQTWAGGPDWERWNDYGIGLLVSGREQLRAAEHAFHKVEELGRVDGPLNLTRVFLEQGGQPAIRRADDALQRARKSVSPAAHPWTLRWLQGRVHRQQGDLAAAAREFQSVLKMDTPETQALSLDFRRDYVLMNLLGRTLFDQALQFRGPQSTSQRRTYLQQAAEQFQACLQLDPENLAAHHDLARLFRLLDQPQRARSHQEHVERLRPDDTARGKAVAAARVRYPSANAAAESVTIYELRPWRAHPDE